MQEYIDKEIYIHHKRLYHLTPMKYSINMPGKCGVGKTVKVVSTIDLCLCIT